MDGDSGGSKKKKKESGKANTFMEEKLKQIEGLAKEKENILTEKEKM